MGLLQMAHDLPHILDRCRASGVNRRCDGGGNLFLAKLRWQKSRDDLDLGFFSFGKLGDDSLRDTSSPIRCAA